jgi:hypothetical protein
VRATHSGGPTSSPACNRRRRRHLRVRRRGDLARQAPGYPCHSISPDPIRSLDLRQRPRLAYRSHGPEPEKLRSTSLTTHCQTINKDANHPARRRRPAELPAMIGYINGSESRPAPQNPERLPSSTLPGTTVASTSPPTLPLESPDPWTCSLQRRRSGQKKSCSTAWHPSQVPLRVPLTAGEVLGSKFEKLSRTASPLTESNRRPSPYHG